jgi:hypothetical protein
MVKHYNKQKCLAPVHARCKNKECKKDMLISIEDRKEEHHFCEHCGREHIRIDCRKWLLLTDIIPLTSVIEDHEKLETIIGYGTFITRYMFSDKKNVRVVTVKGFKRVFNSKAAWYPFVLQDENASLKALAFEVTQRQMLSMDSYEGYFNKPEWDLYSRVKITMIDVDGKEKEAWIYKPTGLTIKKLNISSDWPDTWIDVMKKDSKIVEMFPALFPSNSYKLDDVMQRTFGDNPPEVTATKWSDDKVE